MKELVIFDVDNTIVKGQSQNLFLKYLLRKKKIGAWYFTKLTFWFVLYKLGLVHNPQSAMEYGFQFVKEAPVSEIEALGEDFFQTDLKKTIFPGCADILKKHKEEGREVILVSNACEPIIKAIARHLGVTDYLSTRLETKEGKYTGKIEGSIMYGPHKVAAVQQYVSEHGYRLADAWGYGDHISDQYLLDQVAHPYAVNATKGLRRIAKQKGWDILDF